MKKAPNTVSPQNFSVVTADGEATILIYGIIGEDMWSDFDKQNTDEAIALALADLDGKYPVINVRLNSPGGDVMHGFAIINAMKRCKSKVVTWNDGLAASMASGIWLAGAERHMAENALFMVHSPLNFCWGNAKEMREMADQLDVWESGMVTQLAAALGISAEEAKAGYFDGEDHWLSFAQCCDLGLCPSPEPAEQYQAQNVQNVQGQKIQDLYALYRQKPAASEARPNMAQRFRAMFGKPIGAADESHSSPTNDFDMTKEELTQAMIDALAAHESAKAAAQTPPGATTPATGGDEDPLKALSDEIAAMKTKNDALEAQVLALGAAPGAAPASGHLPPGDPSPIDSAQAAWHQQALTQYESAGRVRFSEF